MAGDDRELRFEQPTPLRRREARERGQVPRSRDLIVAVSLLVGMLLLRWWGPALEAQARGLLRADLSRLELRTGGLSSQDATEALGKALWLAALGALPVALVAWLASALVGAAQGGFVWRAAALAPDLSRLSPRQGLKRLLEARSAVRVTFTLAKLCLAAALLWSVLSGAVSAVRTGALGAARSPGELWGAAWEEIVGLGWRAAAAYLVLACADYGIQRWLHERELRMTREEVLEEVARVEGNPEMKRRRLRFGRERLLAGPRGVEA